MTDLSSLFPASAAEINLAIRCQANAHHSVREAIRYTRRIPPGHPGELTLGGVLSAAGATVAGYVAGIIEELGEDAAVDLLRQVAFDAGIDLTRRAKA